MAAAISFLLQFAISQAGIAAQTISLMQGSKEKEKKKNTGNAAELYLIPILAEGVQREPNPKCYAGQVDR